jgi:hypothetical protein
MKGGGGGRELIHAEARRREEKEKSVIPAHAGTQMFEGEREATMVGTRFQNRVALFVTSFSLYTSGFPLSRE